MARYVVAGVGAVGARAVRHIHSLGGADELSIVGPGRARLDEVLGAIGPPVRIAEWDAALSSGPDVVVLATPAHFQPALAGEALDAGAHVVTTVEAEAEVNALMDLNARAEAAGSGGRSLVVGAAFAPGLSCVLALHAARPLASVTEVRVAAMGTAGPACARQHHHSLAAPAHDWDGGQWASHPGGTGREECWFPDPAGAQDCYRAAVAVPLLLQSVFPGAERISMRRAASRRDRMTSRLPMLRPPHKEGLLGALRVELIGEDEGGAVVSRVLGVLDRPGVAAGAVAGLTAHWAGTGGLARTGAGSLAEMVPDTVAFLGQLAERGVKAAIFTGTSEA